MSALGTEFKFMFTVEPRHGIQLSGCDFECTVYTYKNRTVTFQKSDEVHVKKLTDDSYKVVVDKENALRIGRGVVKMMLTIHIPDSDYQDGFRTEVYDDICTGVTVT